MIQREQRKKYSFNAVDALIILAIIAVIGGIAVRYGYYKSERENLNRDTAVVKVVFEDLPEEIATAVTAEREASFQKGSSVKGLITSVASNEAAVYLTGADGKIIKETSDGRYDVTVEIRITGNMSEKGFYAGGTFDIAIGRTVKVYSPDFECSGKVVGIEKE